MDQQNFIIYKTADGKTSIALYADDGNVWLNQKQLAELFDTSKPNIGMHISNILKDKELEENAVVKDYLTTASDGKKYSVSHYSLSMILAIGFRIQEIRGTQFRQCKSYQLRIEDRIRKHLVHIKKCLEVSSSDCEMGALY